MTDTTQPVPQPPAPAPAPQVLTITPQIYAELLWHGHYDPKQPFAYLDFVRRTGNKSKGKAGPLG